MFKKYLEFFWPYLLIIVLLFPLLWPLVTPGFFRSDDGEWMVIRLVAFFDTLRSGQFPVRFLWNLNHGFGYPVTNFLYPLPFYFGSLIHLVGFSFIDSIKIIFVLSFVLSAWFMYILVNKKWGKWAGMAAGLFYVYAPYRIFDVYSRGSLGESVAFIFIPLVFLFLNNKKVIPAALAIAALISSHNVIAFLFFPIIILFMFIKKFDIRNLILVILLALGASSWFWFPALYDLQYTRATMTQVANFKDYFLNFNLLGLIIPAVVVLSIKDKNLSFARWTLLLSLFFAVPISGFLWEISPLPKLVQFPWRFLSVTVFFASILVGSLVKTKKLFFFFMVAIIITTRITVDKIYFGDEYYVTNDDTTTVKNEYMPKWVKSDPTQRTSANAAVYFPGINPSNFDANGIVRAEKITFSETTPRLIADIISVAVIIICVVLLF